MEAFCVCAGMALSLVMGLIWLLIGGSRSSQSRGGTCEDGLIDAGEILAPLDPFHPHKK